MSVASSTKLPVVFVVGSGHCGSTLLDMLLSAHPAMFGTGELKGIEYHARGRKMICACGEVVTACEVWSHVLDAIDGSEISIRQRSLDLLRDRRTYVAKSGSLDIPSYLARQETIYRVLRERTGAKVIIDSTKSPERPMIMEDSDIIAPIMLHIVRDPRAVTWSYVRKYGKWFSHVSPWIRSNGKIEILKRRFKGQTITVRYEDLATDPEKVLQEITAKLKVPYTSAMLDYRNANQHQLAGNRMRLGKGASIGLDTSWQQDMPSTLRSLVWSMSWLLAKRYGYR